MHAHLLPMLPMPGKLVVEHETDKDLGSMGGSGEVRE